MNYSHRHGGGWAGFAPEVIELSGPQYLFMEPKALHHCGVSARGGNQQLEEGRIICSPRHLARSRSDTGQPQQLGGRILFAFGCAWLAEITESAFFQGAVLGLQSDLWRPTGFGFNHAFHHADGAREPVNHDLAEITFASGRYFSFAHVQQCAGKSGGFNA